MFCTQKAQTPKTQTVNPERGTHTYSGFCLHPTFLAVWVLLWLCLWLLCVGLDSPDHPAPNHPTLDLLPPPPDPLRRTAQNFAFFSLSRLHFVLFCVSLGVFSLNFGGFLKAGTLKCARLGSRGLSCETPAASGPPGHDNPKERKTIVTGRKKKKAKFWALHLSRPI